MKKRRSDTIILFYGYVADIISKADDNTGNDSHL